MIVRGKVSELKTSAPIRHLELEIDGNPSGLLADLEGIQSVESRNGLHTVIIDARTDIRGFIARAEEVGALRHFAYTTPSLSDLFREAVQ